MHENGSAIGGQTGTYAQVAQLVKREQSRLVLARTDTASQNMHRLKTDESTILTTVTGAASAADVMIWWDAGFGRRPPENESAGWNVTMAAAANISRSKFGRENVAKGPSIAFSPLPAGITLFRLNQYCFDTEYY